MKEFQDDDLILLIRTFNTLIEKFETQEKERMDFMSSISHDLRCNYVNQRFRGGHAGWNCATDQTEHYLKIVQQKVFASAVGK